MNRFVGVFKSAKFFLKKISTLGELKKDLVFGTYYALQAIPYLEYMALKCDKCKDLFSLRYIMQKNPIINF